MESAYQMNGHFFYLLLSLLSLNEVVLLLQALLLLESLSLWEALLLLEAV